MDRAYYRGSRGEIYDMDCFSGKTQTISSGGLHIYDWDPVTVERRYGERVRRIDKKAKTYALTFTVRGSVNERKGRINRMIETFDRDVAMQREGRIYYNGSYISGFVTGLSVKNGARPYWSDCEIDFYCPYPFWITEETRSFLPDDKEQNKYGFLDYPHPFPYDYASPANGVQHWFIDHYRESNFKMVIYGGAVNPAIMIGACRYALVDSLNSNDYVVIDSRSQTVTKHLSNGTTQNIFWKQSPEMSIFTPIQSGDVLITWDGSFGFDLTIYTERSVPAYAAD